MEKKFYASRLFWLGVLQIAIGVLGLLAPFLEAGNFSPEAFVPLVSGVLTIVLRFLTDEPISV